MLIKMDYLQPVFSEQTFKFIIRFCPPFMAVSSYLTSWLWLTYVQKLPAYLELWENCREQGSKTGDKCNKDHIKKIDNVAMINQKKKTMLEWTKLICRWWHHSKTLKKKYQTKAQPVKKIAKVKVQI